MSPFLSSAVIFTAIAVDVVPGTELPPRVNPAARASLAQYQSFAECLATVDWRLVAPVFSSKVGTAEEQRILERAATEGQCRTRNAGQYSNTQLRLSVAAARYRSVYSHVQFPLASAASPLAGAGGSFTWTSSTGNRPWQAFQALAVCLSERQSGLVHSVLMTDEDSSEERARMAVLAPYVGPCLSPGQAIKISILELRSWLAEAQFQLLRSRAPDQG